MTNVRMKALDTLHVSAVGPENILEGDEFEVPTSAADDLEERGLAKRVGGSKKEPAPDNKMAEAPANKTISAAGITAPAKRTGK
jgi:hypothetical protein